MVIVVNDSIEFWSWMRNFWDRASLLWRWILPRVSLDEQLFLFFLLLDSSWIIHTTKLSHHVYIFVLYTKDWMRIISLWVFISKLSIQLLVSWFLFKWFSIGIFLNRLEFLVLLRFSLRALHSSLQPLLLGFPHVNFFIIAVTVATRITLGFLSSVPSRISKSMLNDRMVISIINHSINGVLSSPVAISRPHQSSFSRLSYLVRLIYANPLQISSFSRWETENQSNNRNIFHD